MTLYDSATLETSPSAEDTVAVLARALAGRNVAAVRRVMAADDSYGPDEGLALLEAYVGIAEKGTRQAILDTVIAIAGTDPYRHAHFKTGCESPATTPAARGPNAPKADDR